MFYTFLRKIYQRFIDMAPFKKYDGFSIFYLIYSIVEDFLRKEEVSYVVADVNP